MSQLQLNSPPLMLVRVRVWQGAPVPEQERKVAHVIIPRRAYVGLSTLAEKLARDGVAVNAFAPVDVTGRLAGWVILHLFLKPFVVARIHHRVAWMGAYCTTHRSRLIVRFRRRC